MNRSSKIGFLMIGLKWLGICAVLIGICGCDSLPLFKSTANQIQDASASIANQLAANLTTDQKLRVGIPPLSRTNGIADSLAQALHESLTNRLFLTKRFDVVEDDDMQKVLQELKIQEQGVGILREDTIHRMGELLGADAILVGTITKVDDYDYIIDCRLVPIKSGVVGSVGEAKLRIAETEIPVAPPHQSTPNIQAQPGYPAYHYQYRGDSSSSKGNPNSTPYYYQQR